MRIQKRFHIPFPPDDVYAAWVSSDTVIPPATAMDINPVVGGHYILIMKSPEFEARSEGRFIAVTPGQHVRYTWEWNGDGEVSEIDVRFRPATGGTTVELEHSGFTRAESAKMHDSGWDSYVAGLVHYLGGEIQEQ
ncbi:MAG: SRPBCC domain-containing protein [Gammaproteobacteria bacterium]|nr:SRPBCC domain-containing protein [Gammaproteobacteria bacterium]